MAHDSHWATSDLATAAYCKMRGLELLGATRKSGGKFEFRFADPNDQGRVLQVEFVNSEFNKFDAEVRSLKKLCYDGAPNRRKKGSWASS